MFTVDLGGHIRQCRLGYGDINHGSELEIVGDFKDLGVDPRILTNATIAFYLADTLGQPHDSQECSPTPENLRFVGIMVESERLGSEGEGLLIRMRFQDYTALFIQNRHYPPDAAPSFDMSISEAWALICDNTGPRDETGKVVSTVSALRDRIEFRGVDDIQLGAAVVPRLRGLAKIQICPDWDAWKVLQQCIGSLGLIAFFELDRLVVTTATDLYTSEDPPLMVWGKNILAIHESRNSVLQQKGVRVKSYDPLTNSTLEAVYPPKGDPRILKKTVVAKSAGGGSRSHKSSGKGPSLPAVDHSDDREEFAYPAVTDLSRLQEIAKRIFEERSRQELEGTLTTVNMTTIRENSRGAFDLLNLRAGDMITIAFDPDSLMMLQTIGSESKQIAYMLERGYSLDSAKYLVANIKDIAKVAPNFHVKHVEVSMTLEEADCDFKIEICYHNTIKITGDTQE